MYISAAATQLRMAPHTLSDISDAQDFTSTYIAELAFIYQYGAQDIQNECLKQDMTVLSCLHKALVDSIYNAFPAFKDKRPINRQVKGKAVTDIFHMGYSLVNKSASKELEKMFGNKQCDTTADSNDVSLITDPSQEMAELILAVSNMRT